jgi:ATP-dependent RNA helicase DeaD
VTDFREPGASEPTLSSLAEMGFEEPTPVQAQAIPLLLAGRDVIAQALTGTGKTAAFGVPIAERVDVSRPEPQAIVMTPTRELAIQVTDHLCKIGRHKRLSVVPIYGGQPIGRQFQALRRGAQVIVATPGRLLDHLRRGSLSLDAVSMLVLDEADQMLEMGFIEDVQFVLDRLPEERVSALFSATMPRPIVELAHRYLRDPEHLRLSRPQGLTVPTIEQIYCIVPFVRKMEALCRVLDVRQPERAIVFCATRRTVDEVVEGLGARGYLAEAIHGDINQAARERVLTAFRAGQFEVLVATDVAARGLDVPEVSHVINFDLPPDPEYYVHRIGRTGRSGRSGVAITFVNPRELRALRIIERVTGAQIRREEVPTVAEVEEREAEMLRERLLAGLTRGDWGRYRPMVEELFDEHDPVEVAAAALKLAAGGGVARRRGATATAVVVPPQGGDERPPAARAMDERPATVQEPAERRPMAQAPAERRPARPKRDAIDDATPARPARPVRPARGPGAANDTPGPRKPRGLPDDWHEFEERARALVSEADRGESRRSDDRRTRDRQDGAPGQGPTSGKGPAKGKGAPFGKPRRPTVSFGKAGPRRGPAGPKRPGPKRTHRD